MLKNVYCIFLLINFHSLSYGQGQVVRNYSYNLPIDSITANHLEYFFKNHPEESVFKIKNYKKYVPLFDGIEFLGYCSYALGAPVCRSFVVFEKGRVERLSIDLLDSIFLSNSLIKANQNFSIELIDHYIYLSDGGNEISSIKDVDSWTQKDSLQYFNIIQKRQIEKKFHGHEAKKTVFTYHRKSRSIYKYEFSIFFNFIWIHKPQKTVIATEIGALNYYK